MKITPCKLEDWSKATYRFALVDLPFRAYAKALIISFTGDANSTREAVGTCRFMDAIIAAGTAAWQPDGLVLDLREIKYRWGDDLGQTIGDAGLIHGGRYLPSVIVTSDLNREGLTSLFTGELRSDPKEHLFDTLEEAVAHLDKIVSEKAKADNERFK